MGRRFRHKPPAEPDLAQQYHPNTCGPVLSFLPARFLQPALIFHTERAHAQGQGSRTGKIGLC